MKPDEDGYISTAGDPNMTSPVLLDDGPNNWSFVSPTRLMFGASYTFGQRGVISVDYERDWYNGIRIKDNPSGLDSQSWYNDSFRDNCKGANIVRVGAEFKPLPVLALRAGFGYSGSMYKDDVSPSSPLFTKTTYYGAGVGFVLGRGVLLDTATVCFVQDAGLLPVLCLGRGGIGRQRGLFDRGEASQRGADAGIPFLKAYIFNIKVRLCCGPLFFCIFAVRNKSKN